MKLFLAALNSELDKLKHRTKYLLVSYSDFQTPNKELNFTKYIQNLYTDDLLLDSGAFSYMGQHNNGEVKIDWDKYIEDYANFINKYDIKYFFELDIDIIVGLKEVERLRKKLEDLTGKKPIVVWHESRGVDYWKWMVKNYNYIAIGSLVKKTKGYKNNYKALKSLVEYANKHNVKVHGLGFTRKEILHIPFYSVDSTSWAGVRFSYTYYKYIGKGTIKGNNIYGFNRSKRGDLLNHNLLQWNKLQDYMIKHFN